MFVLITFNFLVLDSIILLVRWECLRPYLDFKFLKLIFFKLKVKLWSELFWNIQMTILAKKIIIIIVCIDWSPWSDWTFNSLTREREGNLGRRRVIVLLIHLWLVRSNIRKLNSITYRLTNKLSIIQEELQLIITIQ